MEADRRIDDIDMQRWSVLSTGVMDDPCQSLPGQVRASSKGRPWRGLAVWHQVGPPGDLYIPPMHADTILVRHANPTELLQRHGNAVRQQRWLPGEAIIVPSGVPTFWRSGSPRDNIHIDIDPAWLQRVAGGRARRLPSSFGRRDPVLCTLATALLASLDTDTSLQPAFGEHMACVLAVHLLEHYAQPEGPRTAGLSRRQMDTVVDAVTAAPEEKWPLPRLAALIDLSPFHFARAFKMAFGTTPHAYVCAQRMQMAARLIRSTTMPLTDIAATTGHASAAHFAQAFQRHWGLTPTAFRRGA